MSNYSNDVTTVKIFALLITSLDVTGVKIEKLYVLDQDFKRNEHA